jgi:hypothetical protein
MKIHPWLAIMVALSWPAMGFLLAFVMEKLFKIELAKLASSGINLDTFLFFVQVPGGSYYGLQENILYYGILWLMVGVGYFIIGFAAERLHVQGKTELYITSPVEHQ